MTEKEIIQKLNQREVNEELASDIAYVLSLDYDKTVHWILANDYRKEAIKDVARTVNL